ncbi:MAG: RAMP superfamily CRISPR-associated protein, partial [Bacteroidota bacterium]
MKLSGKIIIKGSLITKTGLHIGGSKASLNIGGIENNVIKTALEVPYIPGSSLKGKLRSLLARAEGSLFFYKEDRAKEVKAIKELLKDGQANPALERFLTTISNSTTDEDREYLLELFGYSGDVNKTNNLSHTRLLVRDA